MCRLACAEQMTLVRSRVAGYPAHVLWASCRAVSTTTPAGMRGRTGNDAVVLWLRLPLLCALLCRRVLAIRLSPLPGLPRLLVLLRVLHRQDAAQEGAEGLAVAAEHVLRRHEVAGAVGPCGAVGVDGGEVRHLARQVAPHHRLNVVQPPAGGAAGADVVAKQCRVLVLRCSACCAQVGASSVEAGLAPLTVRDALTPALRGRRTPHLPQPDAPERGARAQPNKQTA